MQAGNHNKKLYEVFFRYIFTHVHPHTDKVGGDQLQQYYPEIALDRLSHITHNKEALAIMSGDGECKFNPKERYGKAYKWDGSPKGESFRDSFLNSEDEIMPNIKPPSQLYMKIDDRTTLMPRGFYSWWGISVPSEYSQLCSIPNESCPSYLQSPQDSQYGNKSFSIELSRLLQCYQTSHEDEKPDVYLLRGGTLRYKHEVCYVIIVCTESHRHSEPLKEYPAIKPGAKNLVVDFKKLTDDNGIVKDYSGKCRPIFTPQYLNTSETWESVAFAFYFNRRGGRLICPSDAVDLEDIEHSRCFKKRQFQEFEKWRCPNDIP